MDTAEQLSSVAVLTGSTETEDSDRTEIQIEDAAPPAPLRSRLPSRKRKATSSSNDAAKMFSMAKRLMSREISSGTSGFANYVAEKLSKLDESQKDHAERLIFEALSKAAAKELNASAKVVVERVEQRHTDLRMQSYQNLWPQPPEPHFSTPVRRNGPSYSFAPQSQPTYNYVPPDLASPSRHRNYNQDGRFLDL
ncbi:uncharacterized protein LOC143769946 [Ranitomeya variabilis]|uniref:uncharacterized protein LOC143769946 n=1 Tax=Ranitomeya variabilis TaxID=490064 RepID=UPI004057921D